MRPELSTVRLQESLGKAARPGARRRFQQYQINVPQLNIDVDRVKVKRQNVNSPTCSRRCSVSRSLYVNDFNRFRPHLPGRRPGGRSVPLATR